MTHGQERVLSACTKTRAMCSVCTQCAAQTPPDHALRDVFLAIPGAGPVTAETTSRRRRPRPDACHVHVTCTTCAHDMSRDGVSDVVSVVSPLARSTQCLGGVSED